MRAFSLIVVTLGRVGEVGVFCSLGDFEADDALVKMEEGTADGVLVSGLEADESFGEEEAEDGSGSAMMASVL